MDAGWGYPVKTQDTSIWISPSLWNMMLTMNIFVDQNIWKTPIVSIICKYIYIYIHIIYIYYIYILVSPIYTQYMYHPFWISKILESGITPTMNGAWWSILGTRSSPLGSCQVSTLDQSISHCELCVCVLYMCMYIHIHVWIYIYINYL